MISVKDLYVKAGDLVIPAWRRMVEFLSGLPVLPGVGVLVRRTPRGSIVSSRAFVKGFSGSWGVSEPGDKTVIGDGYVNGVLPSIDGKRLTPQGTEKNRPTLKITPKKFDKTGRSWICVEVELKEGQQRFDEKDVKALRLVQADDPFKTGSKLIGRHPVACLYRGKAKAGLGVVHRMCYFDLQHRYLNGRHFFFV